MYKLSSWSISHYAYPEQLGKIGEGSVKIGQWTDEPRFGQIRVEDSVVRHFRWYLSLGNWERQRGTAPI